VIVSVRVRPNLTGTDGSASDGDWVVDGRRGLISYKGKEGGVDYLYGANI
jgi:centromeric protein E